MIRRLLIALVLVTLVVALPTVAQPAQPAASRATTPADARQATASQMPPELQGVGFEQRLGESLPLDARFTDESGVAVTLGEYFDDRPVVLALVYYDCPMLCGLVLNGMASSLKAVELTPGEDFEIVVLSIDPGETPEMAMEAKTSTVERYGKADTAGGWHFLTGEEEEIRRVADAAGFTYRYDSRTDLYVHAGGLLLATADGRAARYFYGVEYPPRDVRLGLVEASDNRIGSPVDRVLLFCFQYDPSTGKYSAAVLNLIRAGGFLTLLVLGLLIGRMILRERRQRPRSDNTAKSNLGTA
ncbi:MAG: SCO family protein [Acidobacteriota bacterium]|nr:SCO family protein [Acidobacteriota bacterium]